MRRFASAKRARRSGMLQIFRVRHTQDSCGGRCTHARIVLLPLLATLQEHEVSELARAMQPAVLRDGDYVYRQGDAAKEFYIVLTGSVQKVVESGDGS